jgi:hypothetical protein
MVRAPERAQVIVDAFIAKKYAVAAPGLRAQIASDGVAPSLRARLIDLARVSKDKDSAKYVEKALLSTQDNDIKREALRYFVDLLPSEKVLITFLNDLKKNYDDLIRDDGSMENLSVLCPLQTANPTVKRLEDILLGLFSEGEVHFPQTVSSLFGGRDFSRERYYLPLVSAQRPSIIGGRIGIYPKKGGTVYSWPFYECAEHLLSAIRSEATKQNTQNNLRGYLAGVGKRLVSENRSSVQTGLLLRLRTAKITELKDRKTDVVLARFSDARGSSSIRLFEEEKFGSPITIENLELDAIQAFGFLNFDTSEGGYVAAEEKVK